jgi:type IV pilus assembly protein PilA
MRSEFKAKLIQHLLNRKDSEKGFTLIELLVVVIIIGILAAIALPTFLGQVNKSRQAEARNYVATAIKAQQIVYLETNAFAVDFNGLQGEVGLQTDLRYYTPSLSTTNASGTNFAATANVYAAPKRPTLKSYIGVAWTAQIGGATIPEVYTQVFESIKAGTATVAVAGNTAAPTLAAPANYTNLGK